MSILREFYSQFVTRAYKKGEIILMQDHVPSFAYAVKVGSVRIYGLLPDGTVNSISFAVSGELFPAGWIFSKADKTLFYYEAQTDCVLYVMEKERLVTAIDTTPELSRVFLDQMVGQYVGRSLQMQALGQPRASAKIVGMLHYLCLRFGTEVAPDRVRIEIPFTQDELSGFIGITRETTTNELLVLKKLKVLTVRSKFYTVNTQRLDQLLDGEYNPGIELR